MRARLIASLGVAVLWPLLTAGSCATTSGGPPPAPREVRVVVPVKCNPQIGPEPVYPDTDAALRAAPSWFERLKMVAAGRVLRIAREGELKAALDACRGG